MNEDLEQRAAAVCAPCPVHGACRLWAVAVHPAVGSRPVLSEDERRTCARRHGRNGLLDIPAARTG